ncbi:hypothetical protein F4802DRAFT_580331 [Xylaria palmicola]|nr:hypothetical protein F4802DRAFT_580331 [Xylaria palmicola]
MSDESETDRGDEFFDMEAEESDGYGVQEDEGDVDERQHYSFPQFARLPPELRAMIWEAADPYMLSGARIFEVQAARQDGELQLWESATLARQTAPARAVLATCRESRRIAWAHYPDVVQLRGGRYQFRFKSANDIILIRGLSPSALRNSRWCGKIQYVAFEALPTIDEIWALHQAGLNPRDFLHGDNNIKAIFLCCESYDLKYVALGWTASESTKRFYLETHYELQGVDAEEFKALYCWVEPTRDARFLGDLLAELEGGMEDPERDYLEMLLSHGMPVGVMVGYYDGELEVYDRLKYRYDRKLDREAGREDGSESPVDSWMGDYLAESEADDYELDGFVVDSSPEASEESGGEEDDGVNAHDSDVSNDEEGSLDGDENDEVAQFEQDPGTFAGFSPLQESSDGEGAGSSPHADMSIANLDHASDASSIEEQPPATTQSGRHKRRIVSSDDESGNEDGGVSATNIRPRAIKRARFVLSDGEDEEDDEEAGGDDIGPEVEGSSSRSKKPTHIILSDSEDTDEERPNDSRGRRPPTHNLIDEEEDNDDEEETEEEDEEEDEEAPRASKPMSLLAKLRQFRSDVPVSPGGGSPDSAEDDDDTENEDDDEGERRFSDAELPESAGEDDGGEY